MSGFGFETPQKSSKPRDMELEPEKPVVIQTKRPEYDTKSVAGGRA